MEHIKMFKNQADAIGKQLKTPLVCADSETGKVTFVSGAEISSAELVDDNNGFVKVNIPLNFKALEDSTISIEQEGTPTISKSIQYSLDRCETWNEYKIGDVITLKRDLRVHFKSDDENAMAEDVLSEEPIFKYFSMSGKIEAYESIQSLFNNSDYVPDYGCPYLFSDCESLIRPPKLPAKKLGNYCYAGMFGYTSLTYAPIIPATTLSDHCYYQMFEFCANLIKAPELPATTLANSCYNSMFYECTSLTKAPVLPATTLVDSCYIYMFNNCSKLNYIKAMFVTDISLSEYQTKYTKSWLYGVATTGTFVKSSSATWNINSSDSIPDGWTVESADS